MQVGSVGGQSAVGAQADSQQPSKNHILALSDPLLLLIFQKFGYFHGVGLRPVNPDGKCFQSPPG